MENVRVEYLGCGESRTVRIARQVRLYPGECPRCGYLGWARSTALTEPMWRRIRKRPVNRRAAVHPV